jgi:hypothetical protein
MKKEALILITAIVMIMLNAIAEAGDFIVEGNVGIGTTTPGAKLGVAAQDEAGLNVTVTKTGTGYTGYLSGAKYVFTDATENVHPSFEGDVTPDGNLSGMDINFTHSGSEVTNHVAALTNMTLSGSGTSTGDWGKVGHAYSVYFKGSTGNGYNYTNPNAYAFALRAMIGTNQTRTHYIRNIGGLQILHSYDNSNRTLSAENLYGIIVGNISQYGSDGLNMVTNAGGIQINKQTDSAGGRISNIQGIWLNGDGVGADLLLGANKETRLYGSLGNFIVNTAGNVGIGATNPTAKVEVAGGDAYTSTAGKGLIVKSPNGSICKRIGIDNNGNIVADSVTCPN